MVWLCSEGWRRRVALAERGIADAAVTGRTLGHQVSDSYWVLEAKSADVTRRDVPIEDGGAEKTEGKERRRRPEEGRPSI